MEIWSWELVIGHLMDRNSMVIQLSFSGHSVVKNYLVYGRRILDTPRLASLVEAGILDAGLNWKLGIR